MPTHTQVDPRPFFAAGFAVKAIKTWPSHDGGGFQYRLYDGRNAVALVRNGGNGGPTDIDWIGLRPDGSPSKPPLGASVTEANAIARAAEISIAAKAKLDALIALLPPIESSYGGPALTIDAEWMGSTLLNHAELLNACKRKTCFRRPSDDESIYVSINQKYSPAAQQWIDRNHPGSIVLNTWVNEVVPVPDWTAPQGSQPIEVTDEVGREVVESDHSTTQSALPHEQLSAARPLVDLDALIASVVGA